MIKWDRTNRLEGSLLQACTDAGMTERSAETTVKRARELARYVAAHTPQEKGKTGRRLERIGDRLSEFVRQTVDEEVLAYFRRVSGPKPPPGQGRGHTAPKSKQGRHDRKMTDKLRAQAEAEGRRISYHGESKCG